MKQFVELRFKPTNEIHSSGFKCLEIWGYNPWVSEEPVLLTKYSDVINLPFIDFNPVYFTTDYSKCFGALSIDISPKNDYIRLFVRGNYRIIVDDYFGSDFLFNVKHIRELKEVKE